MIEIGSVIDGKYKVLNKIGQGGMSTVYLAVNEKANKPWAIKAVKKEGIENLEIVKRGLMAEVAILRKLRHPNLPSIVDVIEESDQFLVVMDYVEGRTLKDVLEETGKIPQDQAIDYGRQLCDVLSYLHSRPVPIIYRDLKPSNLMLRPDGRIILIDFGTAREYKDEKDNTQDTVCLGTQGYAAPEQYGGQGQTDCRTDIYSLGATLYHLVTGHNPSLPPYEIYPIRHWDESLSAGLESIICRCTRKNPEERYESCDEIRYDLDHYYMLDEHYEKEQTRKMKILIFGGFFMLLSGMAGCLGLMRESHYQGMNYENYLEQASAAVSLSGKESIYSQAIELDPSRSEAYLEELNACLSDNIFEEEEINNISKELNSMDSSSGKSYLDCLKTNEEGYTEFCYQMGIACFFQYEGTSGISSSKIWFDRALKSEKYLTGSKRNRAEIYSRMGEYYEKLGRKNVTGEQSDEDYESLYEDIASLNNNELSDFGDNPVTACVLYQELGKLISEHACHMLNTGSITDKDLSKQLDIIEARIPELETEDTEDRIAYLQTQLDQARSSIIAAQQQREHGGEEE